MRTRRDPHPSLHFPRAHDGRRYGSLRRRLGIGIVMVCSGSLTYPPLLSAQDTEARTARESPGFALDVAATPDHRPPRLAQGARLRAQVADPASCTVAAPPMTTDVREAEPGLRLHADRVTGILQEEWQATGDVTLWHGPWRLDTGQLAVDRVRGTLTAAGPLQLSDGFSWHLRGQEARLWLEEERGELRDASYTVLPAMVDTTVPPARGEAEWLYLLDAAHLQLTGATYTTCPDTARTWWLVARDLELDRERGRGVARHVRLLVHDWPVLYLPYLNFPLDARRQSGLLVPSVGYTARTGLALDLPVYWNIAPQHDATFTPRWQARRGILLEVEGRYLTPASQGTLQMAYLPDDALWGADRHAWHWQHAGTLGHGWRLDLDTGAVSDAQYLRDFSSGLLSRTEQVIERRLTLRQDGNTWNLSAALQDFQMLNPEGVSADTPYRRLPQLRWRGFESLTPTLEWRLRGEWVRFDRPIGPVGDRLDLETGLHWRLEDWGYFLQQDLSLRHTRYVLESLPPQESVTRHRQRTVPTLHLQGGLIFERPWGEHRYQTLEPRLAYGWVPPRAQQDFPWFDTTVRPFTADQLYTLQRFDGADRVGDTEQWTTVLTTRVIDRASGQEALQLTGGQVHYLRDRQEPLERRAHSDLVLQLRWQPAPPWQIETTWLQDVEAGYNTEQSTLLRYRAPPYRWHLGYHQQRNLNRNQDRQIDVSGSWPLSRRVTALYRWQHDLANARALEVLGGVEYRSCCHTLRLVARREQIRPHTDSPYEDAILVQWTLTGLGSLDTGLAPLLQEGIVGHDPFTNF
jgi:LPS-assembly protein